MTFQSVAALLDDFLRERGFYEPTSQPLYAYRAKPAELKELEAALREELFHASRVGHCPPAAAQGFCLWAAEWWRRNHTGGPWRWQDLLAALDREELGPGGHRYSMLCQMVVNGLGQWRRGVLRTDHGRVFLVTLACEGGLPLKLVKREGAALRVYFRALMEEIRVFGRAGVPFPTLAERVQDRLPRSLRNQVVYELCGKLAAEIWKLQDEVGEARDPVVELDRSHPGWRDQLPLLLSDEVATALLRNLLTDVAEVVHMGGRLRWERLLEQAGAVWNLKGRLELPATLRPNEIEALFGQQAAERLQHAYFDLLMQPEDSAPTLVAMAAQRHEPASGDYFSLEHIRLSSGALGGASGARSLMVRHKGFECTSEDFRGASAMSDLPWVFVESAEGTNAPLRYVGEGSVNVREPQAFVAATEEWKPQDPDLLECTRVGAVEGEGRSLYRIARGTTFAGPEGTSVVVVPDHQGRSDVVEYRARGRSQRFGREEEKVFLGRPELVTWRATGPLASVPSEQLRWRPDAPGASWIPYGPAALGSGTLRLLRDGQVRCSLRLRIAPPSLEVRYRPTSTPGVGAMAIAGLAGGAIRVPDPGGVDLTLEQDNDSATIEMRSEGEPPESVDILFDWGQAGRLTLNLPYPSLMGGYLAPSGERLPDGTTVAKGATSGVRAMALVPSPHAEFHVECDYRGADLSLVQGWRPFIREPMVRVSGGQHLLDLGSLHRQLKSLLELSSDLEAHLRVLLQSNDVSGFPRCELRIGHYELHLENKGIPTDEWVPWSGQVVIGIREDGSARVEPIAKDEPSVEAISLRDPTAPPHPLPSVAPWTWVLPRGLPAGDWLVTGRTGDLHRYGPVIVRHNGAPEPLSADDTPQQVPDHDDGAHAPDGSGLASRLAEDPGHAAWDQVEGCAGWGPDIPAAAFPLLRAIARHQVAAAVGLLRCNSEEESRQFWTAMESLPFWWGGLQLRNWREATAAYVVHLRQDAQVLAEGGFEMDIPAELHRALTHTLARLPYLRIPLLSLGTELLVGSPTERYRKLASPQKQEELLAERQDGVRSGDGALADLDALPDLHFVSENAQKLPSDGAWRRLWIEEGMSRHGTNRFDVLNAPVLCAAYSVLGRRLRDSEHFRLRSLRELAPQWFDEIHRTSYLFALGVSIGESDGA